MGQVTSYSYDTNNNLIRVSYPDATAKLYHYENTSFVNALTGMSYVDAAGGVSRYSTYAYDSNGKASLTQHADVGVGPQEKFSLRYDSATQTTVTDAAGTQEVMTFSTILGVKNLITRLNMGDGEALSQVFDANNNLTCKQDDEGHVTTYTYNATNQRLSMTAGLSGSCAAPQTTAATRTTTYRYLAATLDLPTQIQRPSVASGQVQTTTLQYTDSAHPLLPTAITQSGFTVSGSAVSRTVELAYNSTGQVHRIDGPRADVNDITTLEYYICTSGGACGQLKKITNTLGQVTTFDNYDANGRLLQSTDPNRVVMTYEPMSRSRKV